MIFGGIQKMTLLDFPEKIACTVFTVGCNFKCPFCHNASFIQSGARINYIESDEVLSFLNTRKGLLDGVCISGGEPLIHQDLEDFIRQVRQMGFLVKLDTNGSFPEKLKKLVSENLIDYVAMDIKNTIKKYPVTADISNCNIEDIKQSVDFLLSGAVPYEFRTTIVRELHKAEDVLNIAEWISGAKRYYLQGFVDSENVLQGGLSSYSPEEMQEILQKVKKILPAAEIRGN
ncbi:anaerobic ribonucleoside-triphosphate reductase activating protein [Eubacteriales bacterium OttesenSCG-928-G02]|nr:anaerobic ribonucleoside-triphosphate reductase activating protein [Eubacteriales bacterium OttesenSCG-928-G02]